MLTICTSMNSYFSITEFIWIAFIYEIQSLEFVQIHADAMSTHSSTLFFLFLFFIFPLKVLFWFIWSLDWIFTKVFKFISFDFWIFMTIALNILYPSASKWAISFFFKHSFKSCSIFIITPCTASPILLQCFTVPRCSSMLLLIKIWVPKPLLFSIKINYFCLHQWSICRKWSKVHDFSIPTIKTPIFYYFWTIFYISINFPSTK